MTWLKDDPAPMPPEPKDVDAPELLAEAQRMTEQGHRSPAMDFFATHCPKQTVDSWGMPLDFSAFDQDAANRLFALLSSPLARGRALMRAGCVLPVEVDLLQTVYPDVFGVLTDELMHAMLAQGPPFPAWAESLIETWYQMPPKQAYAQAQGGEGGGQGKAPRGGQADTPVLPTPADRRDLAVRSER